MTFDIDREHIERLARDQATTLESLTHRHTPDMDPGAVLSERYVLGVRWVTVPCSTCGEALPERQAR